ncbi:hypothetical protein K458DRAFT_284516, partial [Lentithecium fluviatile CBS 122367]
GRVTMLIVGLQFGVSDHPWNSLTVTCLLFFGIIMLSAFFVIQWKFSSNPIMPLRFFGTIPRLAVLFGCFLQALIMAAIKY